MRRSRDRSCWRVAHRQQRGARHVPHPTRRALARRGAARPRPRALRAGADLRRGPHLGPSAGVAVGNPAPSARRSRSLRPKSSVSTATRSTWTAGRSRSAIRSACPAHESPCTRLSSWPDAVRVTPLPRSAEPVARATLSSCDAPNGRYRSARHHHRRRIAAGCRCSPSRLGGQPVPQQRAPNRQCEPGHSRRRRPDVVIKAGNWHN